MTKKELIDRFSAFATGNPGIESLVCDSSDPIIIERLLQLEIDPLTKVQLNQLLGLAHEIGVSDAFFSYYWTGDVPTTYDPKKLSEYEISYKTVEAIISIDHLIWGLRRIYTDALLLCGNVRKYFRSYGQADYKSLTEFVSSVQFDTEAVKRRGPSLPLINIPRDDRYLISEMACKSYGETPKRASDLKAALIDAYSDHVRLGGGPVRIKDLLNGAYVKEKYLNQEQMVFSADEMLDSVIGSEGDIEIHYQAVAEKFTKARDAALENTKKYLSLVNDLDVYVATSMRTRENFRRMADDCEKIFADARLRDLHLRYFDPTMSAAEGHQDKGIIECLMVKCSKVLIYCAGEKESYGKDAEASMALSLGKPVIFLCESEGKAKFYREVHPLSRLIDFDTGVSVGAMVVGRIEDACKLLSRIFRNEMMYRFEQPKPGYLTLQEEISGSVVRLQSSDKLLTEAFWNYYRSARGFQPATG